MEGMEENVSKSLIKVRSAIREQISLAQLKSFLVAVPVNERLEACAICQESSCPEIREAAINFSNNLKPTVVYDSLGFLLDCQKSQNQQVRDFAKSKYNLFNSKILSANLLLLIGKVNSRFPLVGYYANELIVKIEPVDLAIRFKLLSDFFMCSTGEAYQATKKMLLKSAHSLTPEMISANYPVALELKNSDDSEIKNLGEWMYLMVAKSCWSFVKIREIKPFLIQCRQSESEAVKEVAAYLFIKTVEFLPISGLVDELDYFISLQFSTNKEVRCKSRDFALAIMESYADDSNKVNRLYENREFLINCCESKFSSVTNRAKALLNRIPAQLFFEDVKHLIVWHASAYKEARKKIKKILFSIPADMYVDILEDLIDMQKAGDPEQRDLASELARRISSGRLLPKASYIQDCCNSGYEDVAMLARELNFLIS